MSQPQPIKSEVRDRNGVFDGSCPTLENGEPAIDLARYPIDWPDDPAFRSLVGQCREQLSGPPHAAVVPGFVAPCAVKQMVAEAMELKAGASHFNNQRTPWSPFKDPAFPDDHVRNRLQQDDCHLLAGDLIGEDTLNKRLYRWPALAHFLAECLELETLYNHADPFQCLNISYTDIGGEHIWHFDPADFVVSILLQTASSGGAFQYAAGHRNDPEHDYDAISAVIDGVHPSINSLSVDPGDLVLFKGHNTLHRVSPVLSGGPRIIALLGFTREETLISSRERNAFNYGDRINDVWDTYGLPD